MSAQSVAFDTSIENCIERGDLQLHSPKCPKLALVKGSEIKWISISIKKE